MSVLAKKKRRENLFLDIMRIFLEDILKEAEILCEEVRDDLPAKFG